MDLLLHCMAVSMKRDGDLKLAAVSPQAAAILELTRTDRLFEIYETCTDAVRSFTYFLPNAMKHFVFPMVRSLENYVPAAVEDGAAGYLEILNGALGFEEGTLGSEAGDAHECHSLFSPYLRLDASD